MDRYIGRHLHGISTLMLVLCGVNSFIPYTVLWSDSSIYLCRHSYSLLHFRIQGLTTHQYTKVLHLLHLLHILIIHLTWHTSCFLPIFITRVFCQFGFIPQTSHLSFSFCKMCCSASSVSTSMTRSSANSNTSNCSWLTSHSFPSLSSLKRC